MLPTKVKQFIKNHELLRKQDRVLVAYSGGPDSTCLLLVLRELRHDVSAIYVNHRLRGDESEQEERFVRNFCSAHNISLFVEQMQWKKKPANMEEAARKKRYRYFAKVAAAHGFTKVALAHNQNDAVETFLLRLLRGSGPAGLAGLNPRRGMYVRPLLSCTREEVLHCLKQKNAGWFQDTSNLTLQFKRNRIRNELIPYLEQSFNP
ncbi:MAG TPA: tRNA lysidine(34) synthetase TilS, partial [Acidobacteriota bacterium]